MKKISILLIMLCVVSFAFAQDDYMDKIAAKVCDCASDISTETPAKEAQMKIGLCMIKEAMPYADEIKADYGIDMANITGQDGEKLGTILATRMAETCPDVLMILAGTANEGYAKDTKRSTGNKTIKGTVSSIKGKEFISFTVDVPSDGEVKVVWLERAESNINLRSEYKSLKNQRVKVKYYTKTMFDALTEEYKSFNIITEIYLLN